MQNRNSAPKLCSPAPTDSELESAFVAAIRVPDHAWLRPWRFICIRDQRREAFGEVLAAALLKRKPDADQAALDKARAAPLRAPLLVVVVASLTDHPKVPRSEQRLSAGCAAQAILLATEALGYAGIWRTGDGAFDPYVMAELGLSAEEEITGFLYLGTREGRAKSVPQLDPQNFVSRW
ncbi:MAG: nitroreductase family protein [Halioglobus sp.]